MKLFKTKATILFVNFILVLGFIAPAVYAVEDDNTTWEPLNPGIKEEQTAEGDEGMVVSAHPLASKVGEQILKNGGNAADAAVAMQFALNVVEPMMSGIGGGGFMMYYDAEEKDVSIINSRERAPGKATGDLFYDEDGELPAFQDRVRSGKSVGVPGTLKGLEDTVTKHGSGNFDLSDLLQPAIELAEDGHEINWSVGASIKNNADKLSKTAAANVFLDESGEPLKEGDLLVQKDLAKTFKLIAEEGTNVFYGGEIGEAIVEEVNKFGGVMEIDDLKGYKLSFEEPVRGEYKGYEVVTMPPPSSGGITMLQLLKMSEMLDLTSYDIRSPEKYHYLSESMHLAYADRGKYMGDPDEVYIPVEGLLNDDYIESRVDTIKADQANDDVKPGDPLKYEAGSEGEATEEDAEDVESDKEDGETTHFSVVDSEGNAVSYTTTIEQVFGSGIMVEDYGILLNNEMTDFDATPGGANEVAPNRRPLSSMTPTIVLKDGNPYMTVGSPGGMTIITSVTQTIMNAIGYDMDIKDAIEEPRIYSNAYPNIRWEIGISDKTRAEVEKRGHKWEDAPVDIGNVNSIVIETDKETGSMSFFGAADSTRQGSAMGINLPFTDIKGHWAEDYMKTSYEQGWFKGYSDDTFKPENKLKRMQTASLFARILNLEERKSVSFKDIKGIEDATIHELEAAFASNIIRGYEDNTFRPYKEISRAHIALMISRVYEQVNGSAYVPDGKTSFPDIGHYDKETQDAILMLKELGIADGDQGEFKPDNTTTRAHAAKMLVNLSEVLKE